MNRLKSVIRITLKSALYFVTAVIILLLSAILLIRIPSVQKKVLDKTIYWLHEKTKSEIEIRSIALTLNSVNLQGVLFKDLNQDTLLRAGEIDVRIDIPALLNKKIRINAASMKDVVGKLSRTEEDSTFNFNFLIESFAGKKKENDANDTVKEPIDLAVEEVNLENIRFIYDDQYEGIYFTTSFRELALTVDKFDVNTLLFGADELTLEGLTGKVVIRKIKDSGPPDGKTPNLPFISSNKLTIRNSDFSFVDEVNKQSVINVIGNLSVKTSTVDLNKQRIYSDGVFVGQSSVRVNITHSADSLPNNSSVSQPVEWLISSKEVILENNSVGFNVTNEKQTRNEFNANHINYDKVSFHVKDAFYSNDSISGNVISLTASDHIAPGILKFSTLFTMTNRFIEAKQLLAQTKQSYIDADAKISFTSLESLADSVQNMGLQANIRYAKAYPPEIVYFAPALDSVPVFNKLASTKITGKINGKLKDLSAKKLSVTTSGTKIFTSFRITGLPDIKQTHFDVPDLAIHTIKEDIHRFARDYIPETIFPPGEADIQGNFFGTLKEFTSALQLQSSYGNIEIEGSIDKDENFNANILTHHFSLGRLLNNNVLGTVSMKTKIDGNGLDTSRMKVHVVTSVPEFYLNRYTYHNLSADVHYTKQNVRGTVHVADSAVEFDLNGSVSLNQENRHYLANLDLKGADLKRLQLHKEDIRVAFLGKADIRGKDVNTVNGSAGITHIVVSHNGNRYLLDSLLFAAINEEGNSELKVKSAIVGINYKGTFAPADLIKELKNNINHYFPLRNLDTSFKSFTKAQNFKFELQLTNHPVISEVFLPDLKEFEPGPIIGSYESSEKRLMLQASVPKLMYKDIEIQNLTFESGSDENKLGYKLTASKFQNSLVKLDNFEINGTLADKRATSSITSMDENGNKKIDFRTFFTATANDYRMAFDPKDFYIMQKAWTVADDNYIAFSKRGLVLHNLNFANDVSSLSVTSVTENVNSDVKININNFKLDEISRVIEKDTSQFKGSLNGDVVLKPVNNSYGIIADVNVNDLFVKEISVGTVSLKAENETSKQFNIDLKLTGSGNNVIAKGTFIPGEAKDQLNMLVDFEPVTAATFEAFSFGQIRESSGTISGKMKVSGAIDAPLVSGALTFNDVRITPAISNTKLYLKNETLKIEPDGIYFNSFTMRDKDDHPAVINGAINMKNFSDFRFSLEAITNDFLLLNTSNRDNEQYYGKMIVDSRMRIRGTLNAPVITSNVKLKNGSHFTFAVTEAELTTDKGEDIVLFIDSMKFHPILTKGQGKPKQTTSLRNYDISSTIEIDKRATIRLLLDPGSNDSLTVKGDAALSFAIDRSGKMSLTGTYNLTEGNYLVSLENVVKKNFKIEPGSTITWNGDPLDADIRINAIYSIRTSPIDLVAGQIPETEKGAYRQRYPFLVYLKLRGAILTPQIDFEIQLPTSEKGILGGTVDAKLEQLNENPSALNKQVFALLVLNRFIQENPLESETDASSNAARTTVGKFLSSQLNRLSSKLVPGVDVNFDVQSYEDYSSGKKEGRTEVEVGVRKQLFNERVSVQVGGSVDVEGEKAKQNSATDITGDVIIEYKLTKDGRYRLKGFRHNQYEGALEGQIIETGAGILYVRDFESWLQWLLPERKDSVNTNGGGKNK